MDFVQIESTFSTMAEVSVTLAGFSGLVTILRGGRLDNWMPREQFTFWLLLALTLGCVVFSLLPIGLHISFEDAGLMWQTACGTFGSLLLTGLIVTFLAGRKLDRRGHPAVWPVSWFTFPPLLWSVGVILLLDAFGVDVIDGPTVYYFGLLLLLIAGIVQFVFLLVEVSPSEEKLPVEKAAERSPSRSLTQVEPVAVGPNPPRNASDRKKIGVFRNSCGVKSQLSWPARSSRCATPPLRCGLW